MIKITDFIYEMLANIMDSYLDYSDDFITVGDFIEYYQENLDNEIKSDYDEEEITEITKFYEQIKELPHDAIILETVIRVYKKSKYFCE